MADVNPCVSVDHELLSVFCLCSSISVPLALDAALNLNVFDILSQHALDSSMSAAQILEFIPNVSNPHASVMLDRLLCLLSSETLPSHPLLSSSCDVIDGKNVRKYALLPASKYFVTDETGISVGRWYLQQVMARIESFKHLDSVILEGGSGIHRAYGNTTSELIAHHAADHAAMMASVSAGFMKQFLQVYDGFENVGTVVDVGGSTGTCLKHILDKYPNLNGINYDQPHIVASAPSYPRMQQVGGNMLENVPTGDAIFLKAILHDWGDDECVKILGNCKQAIVGEQGKLIVADMAVESWRDPVAAHQMDVMMMASHGNQSRTVEEYKQLGMAAGFSSARVVCIVNDHTVFEFLK